MNPFKTQIDQYLKGDLSGEERIAFEEALKNDPDLVREVEYTKLANEIIVDDALKSVKLKLKNIHEPSGISRRLVAFTIASLLFIGLGVGSFLYYDDSETNTFLSQPRAYNLQEKSEVNDNKPTVSPEVIAENPNEQETTPTDLKEKAAKPEKNTDNQVENESAPVEEKPEPETELISEDAENPENTDTVTVEKNVCEDVAIYADVVIENTCQDVFNGSILIETNSVSGGEAPYEYAILPSTKRIRVSEIPFSEKTYYDSLRPGYYNFLIRDNNGCLSYSERAAYVKTSNCTINTEEIKINTGENESWSINDSIPYDAFFIIKDISTNQILYKEDFKRGEELKWFGKDTAGNYLEKGSYIYKVEYQNGTTKGGTIKLK